MYYNDGHNRANRVSAQDAARAQSSCGRRRHAQVARVRRSHGVVVPSLEERHAAAQAAAEADEQVRALCTEAFNDTKAGGASAKRSPWVWHRFVMRG
jgi:hypothetical protein